MHLYRYVAAAAQNGDPRAVEQLRAIDQFLVSRGLDASTLDLPIEERTATTVDHVVHLDVKDLGPWRIDISNTTRFDRADALVAYRAARHAALDRLALANPGRRIEVGLSPLGRQPLGDLLALLPAEAKGDRIVADVYANGRWIMVAGTGLEGRSLRAEARDIADEVLLLAAGGLFRFPGISARDLAVEVRVLYVSLPADSAVALTHEPAIYAVDPLTDIADAFAGRAALIDVASAPELREAHARLVLRSAIDANPLSPVGDPE